MSDERWIVVPNWETFQHYGDRTPPWIKVYTELNSNGAWCDLSDAERGLLVSIWIEYARSRGVLSTTKVPSKVGQRSRKRQFERLNDAGFIQLSASKPLALARSREVEKKREEVRRAPARAPKPAHAAAQEEFPTLAALPRADETAMAVARIARMIDLGVIHDEVDLEAELRGFKVTGTPAEQLRVKLAGQATP
jgi:hypothetical protein